MSQLLSPHPAYLTYLDKALLSNSGPITQRGAQQQDRFPPPLPLLSLIRVLVRFPLLILAHRESEAAEICKPTSCSFSKRSLPWWFSPESRLCCCVSSPVHTVLGFIHVFPILSVAPYGLQHIVPKHTGKHTVNQMSIQIRKLIAQKWPRRRAAARAAYTACQPGDLQLSYFRLCLSWCPSPQKRSEEGAMGTFTFHMKKSCLGYPFFLPINCEWALTVSVKVWRV